MKIDSYEFGKMVIDGKEYTKDLIIYNDMIIEDWRRSKGHLLKPEDLEPLWHFIGDHKGTIKVLIVGTGYDGLMKLSDEDGQSMFEYQPMQVVTASKTAIAVKQFNEFIEEGGDPYEVAGAFHLTC
jgi:hypothetical protein